MSEKVTPRQAQGIAALLAEPTITAAAERAHVQPKTLYRWLRQPAFTAELRRAQGERIDQAAARLTGGLDQALDELERLMTSAQSETVRRQAATEWLNRVHQFVELRDIEARLTAIEESDRRNGAR